MKTFARLARQRLDSVRRQHNEAIEEERTLISERGFIEFVRRAWPIVESARFVEGWHHGMMAEHAEAVASRQIKRLIVNVPPGNSKSLFWSVLWPAWVWTEIPDEAFIYATYSASLTRRDAIKMRNLINSEWYRARWPHIYIPTQNTRSATEFANNLGGWRFSTTPGGPATGRHPGIQVVDDPSKPRDTKNKSGAVGARLEEVATWWSETMPTRARDAENLARVIIMQRLHDLDLAGRMLREGGWEHLRLPMRFEANDRCRTYVTLPSGERALFAEDPRTHDGELLAPARYPEEVTVKIEKELGPSVAAAQLQQRPGQAGGDIFRQEWFAKRWVKLPERAVWLLSCDARFKEANDSGSYVTIGAWCASGADIYAVDQARGRWSFLETITEIMRMRKKWPKVTIILVENKANGPALVNVMRSKIDGLVLVDPDGSKIDRSNASTSLWEAGNVHLPSGSHEIVLTTGYKLPRLQPWCVDFVAEHLAFPKGANDDQVDQANQALARLRTHVRAGYAQGVEELGKLLGMR